MTNILNQFAVIGTGGGCEAYGREVNGLDVYVTGADGCDIDLGDGWIVGVHDWDVDCLWCECGDDLADLPAAINRAHAFAAAHLSACMDCRRPIKDCSCAS